MHILSAQNEILYLIAVRLLPPCGPLSRPGLKKHKPVSSLVIFLFWPFMWAELQCSLFSFLLFTTFLRLIPVGMWISISSFGLHAAGFLIQWSSLWQMHRHCSMFPSLSSFSESRWHLLPLSHHLVGPFCFCFCRLSLWFSPLEVFNTTSRAPRLFPSRVQSALEPSRDTPIAFFFFMQSVRTFIIPACLGHPYHKKQKGKDTKRDLCAPF